jgi:hypothetical protein
MTVVRDTSVLCYLALIDCVAILPRRFGTVTIPNDVAEECLHPRAPEMLRALLRRRHGCASRPLQQPARMVASVSIKARLRQLRLLRSGMPNCSSSTSELADKSQSIRVAPPREPRESWPTRHRAVGCASIPPLSDCSAKPIFVCRQRSSTDCGVPSGPAGWRDCAYRVVWG